LHVARARNNTYSDWLSLLCFFAMKVNVSGMAKVVENQSYLKTKNGEHHDSCED